MHTANRVIDVFPRTRPTPMSSDMIDEMMKAIGPNTPGEKLDQIISGVVPPANVVIDMQRFDRRDEGICRGGRDVRSLRRGEARGAQGLQGPAAASAEWPACAARTPGAQLRAATSAALGHWSAGWFRSISRCCRRAVRFRTANCGSWSSCPRSLIPWASVGERAAALLLRSPRALRIKRQQPLARGRSHAALGDEAGDQARRA